MAHDPGHIELHDPETDPLATYVLEPDDLRPLLRGDLRTAYVCGSTGFAETASRLLVDLGVPADAVRVERFGPTGT